MGGSWNLQSVASWSEAQITTWVFKQHLQSKAHSLWVDGVKIELNLGIPSRCLRIASCCGNHHSPNPGHMVIVLRRPKTQQ